MTHPAQTCVINAPSQQTPRSELVPYVGGHKYVKIRASSVIRASRAFTPSPQSTNALANGTTNYAQRRSYPRVEWLPTTSPSKQPDSQKSSSAVGNAARSGP